MRDENLAKIYNRTVRKNPAAKITRKSRGELIFKKGNGWRWKWDTDKNTETVFEAEALILRAWHRMLTSGMSLCKGTDDTGNEIWWVTDWSTPKTYRGLTDIEALGKWLARPQTKILPHPYS